jgi:7-carboxy-7-deazaguanine synthase
MTVPYPPHRLALLAAKSPGRLLVHEIYRSIQGESTFAGLPCAFVRTSVCGQRCTWCDTPHAFTEGTELDPDEVMRRVRELMTRLADEGFTVLLETGGAEDVSRVDPRVRIIMDLKCPDSGECERNNWANLDRLKPVDEIKFVLASRRDFDWAVDAIRAHRLDRRFAVLLSAAFGAVPLDDLAAWVLASGLDLRLQLQMHKYIWDPKARGV